MDLDATGPPQIPAHQPARKVAEVARQGAERARLREAYPGTPMIVAGDFNQDRDASGWYGTHHVPQILTDELRRNDLQVVTDVNVVEAGLHDGNLVDHIAVTSRLIWGGSVMSVMGLRDSDGIRLSDHPTVIVELLMRSVDDQPAADAGV
ncbi:MAG: endonuclease/exonuclease/phosphatase family metal-dependent hydrolase [Nitriliruptoraceae bacterium]|jgi:endonuclease/exonuclease/phosphatase family metal-dependent hydrolase